MFQPDAVGFFVITPNYPVARQQLRALRLAYPELPVVVGGIHASMFPEDLLADGATAVVLGEGELVISDLLECLCAGREPDRVTGVVYRNRAGAIVRTSGWSQTSALDELPFVDRSLLHICRGTRIIRSWLRAGARTIVLSAVTTRALFATTALASRWHEKVVDDAVPA